MAVFFVGDETVRFDPALSFGFLDDVDGYERVVGNGVEVKVLGVDVSGGEHDVVDPIK